MDFFIIYKIVKKMADLNFFSEILQWGIHIDTDSNNGNRLHEYLTIKGQVKPGLELMLVLEQKGLHPHGCLFTIGKPVHSSL